MLQLVGIGYGDIYGLADEQGKGKGAAAVAMAARAMHRLIMP
jgi:hypothetical protein